MSSASTSARSSFNEGGAMKRLAIFLLLTLAACAAPPSASERVTVLSAGAVETGLQAALELYGKSSGRNVAALYNTAPQIRERIAKGEQYDVVVVPPGSVGQGVAVRAGAPLPDLSSVEAMSRALREADAVVFNRATGGQYIESMLKKIGVYGDIE